MTNLTSMLMPVEKDTIPIPVRAPNMEIYLGSRVRILKMGSMNMLPSMSTIIACRGDIPLLLSIGPSSV